MQETNTYICVLMADHELGGPQQISRARKQENAFKIEEKKNMEK